MQNLPQEHLLCRALGIAMLLTSSAIAREVPLLAPSQGQLPTDVGTDDVTKLSLVDQSDLGGKALRVERLAGDSFGDRIAKVTDWKQFIMLKFDAVNPDQSDVKLIFSVKHRRTTGYQTRVDMPFTLKPGKNSVVLGIEWAISVTPDPRIPSMHEELRKVPGSAFEVVVSPHTNPSSSSARTAVC